MNRPIERLLCALICIVVGCGTNDESTKEETTSFVVRSGGVGSFGRTVVLPGIADPDAFVDGNRVLIVGTFDTRSLPIWQLSVGSAPEVARYDPSQSDPAFDYCHVWAPEINRLNNQWVLAFAATRVPNGASCEPNFDRQMIMYALASNDLRFGAPLVPDFGPGAPRSIPTAGCPRDGCDKAMRIDAALFVDLDGRAFLSYTYYDGGNHNATIALDDPTRIIRNTSPVHPNEERVNEAPEIFQRNGKYYLLYSAGGFAGEYRLMYIMGSSVADLTKRNPVHQLTVPVHRRDGRKFENAGHGSIVEFQGTRYAIYHVGEMNAAGAIVGRDTVVSPVAFAPDGTMRMLNAMDVSWNNIASDRVYSVDVRAAGRWVAPCVDAGIIGRRTQVRLTDLCPAGDQLAPLETVDRIRVCHAPGGDWRRGNCQESAFNRSWDQLFVPLSL